MEGQAARKAAVIEMESLVSLSIEPTFELLNVAETAGADEFISPPYTHCTDVHCARHLTNMIRKRSKFSWVPSLAASNQCNTRLIWHHAAQENGDEVPVMKRSCGMSHVRARENLPSLHARSALRAALNNQVTGALP